jgi:glycosyltransferase involved in cell wall biosynthesis
MTEFPLITIAIAVYRSADTVARAIESALAQDWPNVEVLIVDDSGPGDDAVNVIRKTIEGHKNARLIIHETNKGSAAALNTMIAEAKGEFFALFDDDDVSLPTRVRRQYERITQYEAQYGAELVICHVARMQRFPNGYTRYEQTMGTRDGIAPHGDDVADRILMGRLSPGVVGSCANCARMARISLFRKMNGYDAGMRRAEDTDFSIRLARAGGHFVGIADPLVNQTMTMGQEKTLQAEHRAELIVLEKHRDYLEQRGWYDFCQQWLEARYEYLGADKKKFTRTLTGLVLKHPLKILCKLFWIIPAHSTRRDFKRWHHAKLSA